MRLGARGKTAFGFLGLAVIGGLAGCATFGGNVRGNFSCVAPGGSCAPTSAIDDQALASIGEGDAEPAGSTAPAARGMPMRSNRASATVPGRGLRIVLPARVDRFGRWREPQIVYADVAMVDLAYAAPSPREHRPSLSELAAGAPGMSDTSGGALPPQALSSPGALGEAVRAAYRQGLQASGPAHAQDAVPTHEILGAPATAPTAMPGSPGTGRITAPAFPGTAQVQD